MGINNTIIYPFKKNQFNTPLLQCNGPLGNHVFGSLGSGLGCVSYFENVCFEYGNSFKLTDGA